MPIANGLALAAQIRGEKRVAVAYFGDGAANIGAFHEALNMAAVWKLPVLFVCQNNGYGEHTRYEIATSAAKISDRAASYQMPGVTVTATIRWRCMRPRKTAIERARAGDGPDADRGDDIPLSRPRVRRCRCVHAEGRKGGGHGAAIRCRRSAPGCIANGHASEAQLAALEAGIEQRDRCGGGVCAREPEPGRRGIAARCVCAR